MSQSTGRIQTLKPDRLTVFWLITALTLVLVPHLPRLPFWFSLLYLFTVLERISHFFIDRKPIPNWFRIGLTFAAMGGVLLTYNGILGRQPGIALLCVMLALKLLETYRRRDIYMVITIAYFVVVTQFLQSQSFYLVGYMLGTVIFITGTLIVVELQPSRRATARDSTLLTADLFSHLKNASWMLAQGVPLMIALFLLFPRFASPFWGLPQDALDGKTGLNDEMAPGLISELFIDDSAAFRVKFEGPVPPAREMYWRGPVLWNFDGLTWTRPDFMIRSPASIDLARVTDPLVYEVTMEPTQRNWLFALDVPVIVPSKGGLQLDHTIYQRRPIIDLTTYSMSSDPDYKVDEKLKLVLRNAALALPGGRNPRTLELARQWRAEDDNDRAIVQRAMRMFNEQEFVYSFNPPPLGINTVDDFLFETRNGYCEYYSSSFTALMRAAGIPARVVTGYQGGYYNEEAGYVLVRNSDAHAWSEVWLEGDGWVRLDPTAQVAPERIFAGALSAIPGRRSTFDFSWLRAARNRFDALHNFWNQSVLKFDRARQRSLLQPMGIDDFETRDAMIILIIVCAGFVGFVMRVLWRAQWLSGFDPVARVYARFCRKLERSGLSRRPSEGPRDFGCRAINRFEHHEDAIRSIIDRYVALRYGKQGKTGQYDDFKRMVAAFKLR